MEMKAHLQFADIWALIWNNLIWYALCIGFCLVVACFYIYRTPKTYSRKAKVIIEEDENSSLGIFLLSLGMRLDIDLLVLMCTMRLNISRLQTLCRGWLKD
jgi:uncharacterized protein involved in exopolysaccharide biosynthesis